MTLKELIWKAEPMLPPDKVLSLTGLWIWSLKKRKTIVIGQTANPSYKNVEVFTILLIFSVLSLCLFLPLHA